MSGKCEICLEEINVEHLTKHIKKCLKGSKGETENILLRICTWHYGEMYWLFLLMPNNTKLITIDKYLREIWLECCNHMSEFEFNKVVYDKKKMSTKIKDVAIIGKLNKSSYTYDFGSTTLLCIDAISLYKSENDKIKLICRNSQFIMPCENAKCNNQATELCKMCDNMFCYKCINKVIHKKVCNYDKDCDIMPILNSPRFGVCGYTNL